MHTMAFTDDQLHRYSRHLLLPEFSGRAQQALLDARALVIGAGGLGSAAIYYLAAAGVGHLTILDADTVELSNLQRQIIHTNADLGSPKAESAAAKVRALNPDVTVEPRVERFTVKNARELVATHDVVIDGSDNFETRYLSNDACFFERKPLCFAAVLRFEGQASTFFPGQPIPSFSDEKSEILSPCYRCLFPEPPPAGLVPSCAEAGVLGVTVGQMGMVQAAEAIKIITGVGEPLVGRFQLFDGLNTTWRTIKLKRSPGCPLCGDTPTITKLRAENIPTAEECRRPD
jgi:adenylyltransferase/sulfurtransferase